MAMCVSSIVKRGCNLLAKNGLRQLMFNATRTLYTPNSMGMHGYLNARDYVKSQFVNVDHLFFQKMRDFVDKEDEAMIFTEDLKTMLHLVEKKPEDLDLLYKMMKKYNLQNNLRFGSFVFGTVVMRTFYHLDEPDLALKAFKDPELANFFDQIITYQLLMDMLYNHGRYADVRDVYNIVKTKNVYGIANPKNPFILVMGACYKENTKESLEYAVQLFKEGQDKGFDFPRRAITFLAGLALKQDAPEIALEAASLARNVRYIDIRCIKVEAYVALNRIDEVMVYFRNTLQNDLPNRRKQCYFKDTIEKVQALVEKLELDETSDLVKILNQIKLHDYIQPTTLEEHLCSTIDQIKNVEQKPWERRDGNRQAQATRYSDRFQNQHQYDRPGLKNQI